MMKGLKAIKEANYYVMNDDGTFVRPMNDGEINEYLQAKFDAEYHWRLCDM
jgi:hypothetical protein